MKRLKVLDAEQLQSLFDSAMAELERATGGHMTFEVVREIYQELHHRESMREMRKGRG